MSDIPTTDEVRGLFSEHESGQPNYGKAFDSWFEYEMYKAKQEALNPIKEWHQPFKWSFGFGPVYSCKGCVDQGMSQEDAQWPCPTAQRFFDGWSLP